MSPRYSRYKSKFYINPEHEKQANSLVNAMGSEYILEGAANIGSGDLRVWVRHSKTDKYECKIIPIVVNFDENSAPVLIPETKEIKEEKDSATDEQFLIEKK